MSSVRMGAAVGGVVLCFVQSAFATDLPVRTNAPPLPVSMLNFSGGNDWSRYEIAPNWSRELGWSLKGAFGSYITNDLAVGAIVEYGQGKREYLTNAGVRLSDKLSFIGSVGMLEEHREFVADAGKETVQQMEYGASLKGAYDIGMFHGFELNTYLADAYTKSDSIETGKLYGTQILTTMNVTDSTRIRFGGGYEWLHWDDGEDNNAVSFRADGTQRLTNRLSAVASVKLGASENVYGGGLNYNLGDRTNTNIIGINYDHIEGKNGIQSDQRIELTWTMGMGVGPNSSALSGNSKAARKSNSLMADASNAPANTLLADVMQRPEFLPQRVLARAKGGGSCSPTAYLANPGSFPILTDYSNLFWYYLSSSIVLDTKIAFDQAVDLYSATDTTFPPTSLVLIQSGVQITSPPDNTYVAHSPTTGGILGLYKEGGVCKAIYWRPLG